MHANLGLTRTTYGDASTLNTEPDVCPRNHNNVVVAEDGDTVRVGGHHNREVISANGGIDGVIPNYVDLEKNGKVRKLEIRIFIFF